MSAATLFSVPVVTDDLDAYPGSPNDPILGTTTFSWSLKAPNATGFASLGIVANSVVLDPAAYTVGDQLELRVDIADRNGTTLTSSMPRTWNRGISPLFWNVAEGNRAEECSAGALVTSGDAAALPVEFPRALGNVLRHNSLIRNRSDGVV